MIDKTLQFFLPLWSNENFKLAYIAVKRSIKERASCALVKLLFHVDAKHLKKIALKCIHLSITWVYTENALDLTIIVNCFVWLFGLGGLCKKFLSQWLTQAFLNWNSKSIETETEIKTGVTWRGVWQSHFKSPLVKTYWLQYTIDSKKCNFSVTKLCKFLDISGDVLLKPIIEAAGKDITHWFDKKTKDVSSCVLWYLCWLWAISSHPIQSNGVYNRTVMRSKRPLMISST